MHTVAAEIEVRHCYSLAEYDECVRLERLTWGEDITVPAAIFVVARHSGGQVLGAFDAGRMVGFTLALAGLRDAQRFLHSHMTAVLPEFQNRGVARRLKLFQRHDALKRGIPLVEWTFDPLELKNARFNLSRLGAVVRRYLPDCYGLTNSPLHDGLPTDRLVAEWWLRSERVESLLKTGKHQPLKPEMTVAVPAEIYTWKSAPQHRHKAEQVQARNREMFLDAFSRGLAVLGYERDAIGNGTFLLGKWEQ